MIATAPVGWFPTKGSPSWHHHVIQRWAVRRRIHLGSKGYIGYALFVEATKAPYAGGQFVVEGRGPGSQNLRVTYPFYRHAKGLGSRSQAFQRALELLLRLQGPPRVIKPPDVIARHRQ